MNAIVTAALDNPLATGIGILAMICLAVSPLFKGRGEMLGAQLATSVGYGIHYALTGATTAAVFCGFNVVQVVLAIPLAARPSLKPWFNLFFPVIALSSLLTWHGWQSGVSALALALTTWARMQDRTMSLRALMVGAQSAWLLHDMMVESLPAVAGDFLALATGIAMVGKLFWSEVPPLFKSISVGMANRWRQSGYQRIS